MSSRSATLSAEPESIAAARGFVDESVSDLTWLRARFDDVRIVVSEVVTNAVRAQRQANPSAAIELVCKVGSDVVELVVIDHGGGFESPGESPPWPAGGAEGGYGLPLIMSLADGVHFDRLETGTRVEIVWRRHRD